MKPNPTVSPLLLMETVMFVKRTTNMELHLSTVVMLMTSLLLWTTISTNVKPLKTLYALSVSWVTMFTKMQPLLLLPLGPDAVPMVTTGMGI